MKKLKKEAEKITEILFKEYCTGVQFDIFDLSSVSSPVESLYIKTQDLELCKALIQDLREKYRKN